MARIGCPVFDVDLASARGVEEAPVAAYRHPDGYLRVIHCTAAGDVRE